MSEMELKKEESYSMKNKYDEIVFVMQSVQQEVCIYIYL
jgi:hypothetical protein